MVVRSGGRSRPSAALVPDTTHVVFKVQSPEGGVYGCWIMARGALIVVEGLDRAGKSSQCEWLRGSLQKAGHSVKYIRFPGISIPFICLSTGSNLEQTGRHLLEN